MQLKHIQWLTNFKHLFVRIQILDINDMK